MAEGDKKEGNTLNAIKKIFSSQLVPVVKEGFKSLLKKAQDIIYQTEKKIIENVLAAIILITGFIFMIVGIAFFINEYFDLSPYWGFLLMGLLLMVIAYIFKIHIDKTKYYKME